MQLLVELGASGPRRRGRCDRDRAMTAASGPSRARSRAGARDQVLGDGDGWAPVRALAPSRGPSSARRLAALGRRLVSERRLVGTAAASERHSLWSGCSLRSGGPLRSGGLPGLGLGGPAGFGLCPGRCALPVGFPGRTLGRGLGSSPLRGRRPTALRAAFRARRAGAAFRVLAALRAAPRRALAEVLAMSESFRARRLVSGTVRAPAPDVTLTGRAK